MFDISVTIKYAGLQLEVVKNDAGEDCVPLKPLSDLFGLRWRQQQTRIEDPYIRDYLGVCTLDNGRADDQKREVICIKLDRVAAYLMGLNSAKIRAHGNISGADFLQTKQTEWADMLHEYELLGYASNPNHADQIEGRRKLRASLCQLIGIKNKCAHKEDRKILSGEIADVAGQLGHTYQPDLLDDGADKKPGASDQPDLLEE